MDIIDRSSIAEPIFLQDFDTKVETYTINGTQQYWLNFLVDEIYIPWSIFAKTDHVPVTEAELKYSKQHEYVCTDIEHFFSIVISKFAISKCP